MSKVFGCLGDGVSTLRERRFRTIHLLEDAAMCLSEAVGYLKEATAILRSAEEDNEKRNP